MRRNLYILAQCTFLLFITLLVNGCSLHEEPEMTPEGELGVDPTAVTLNLNLYRHRWKLYNGLSLPFCRRG